MGVGWAFAANAASYIPVIYALMALKLPPHQPRGSGDSLKALSHDAKQGWRYAFTHPVLSWMLPMVGIMSMLTWSISDMLPGIVDQVITMADIPDANGQPQRAFVCQTLNSWGYPAKDRSGRLDMVEASHLGRLMEKIQRPAGPASERLSWPLVIPAEPAAASEPGHG